MQKQYLVRFSQEERCELQEVLKKLKGSSQKVRPAQTLLKADIEGAKSKVLIGQMNGLHQPLMVGLNPWRTCDSAW